MEVVSPIFMATNATVLTRALILNVQFELSSVAGWCRKDISICKIGYQCQQ